MSSFKRSRSGTQVAQRSDSKTEVESVDAGKEFWSLATEIQEEIVESQWRWLQSLDVGDAIKSEIYLKLCECTGAAITKIFDHKADIFNAVRIEQMIEMHLRHTQSQFDRLATARTTRMVPSQLRRHRQFKAGMATLQSPKRGGSGGVDIRSTLVRMLGVAEVAKQVGEIIDASLKEESRERADCGT